MAYDINIKGVMEIPQIQGQDLIRQTKIQRMVSGKTGGPNGNLYFHVSVRIIINMAIYMDVKY